MTHVVNFNDWESAGTLEKAMRPGDAVADEIVAVLRDELPTAWDTRELFQFGEPYSHVEDPETGKFRPTFSTFARDGEYWRYCGHCFLGETQHREG